MGSGTREEDACAATGTWRALEGKALTEPAQPRAEGICCGSGTRGFNFSLSVQFFPPCKERLQQAKQIRGL